MMTGADAEQFSLKWNNFHKNLQSGFHSLFKEVDLVDVTLAAEGQFVQAHKIVLSVCSPYFKQLFKVNPCKHPIVILKDVCHKELIAILQFMYQGEVNVNQEELATFLKTAELLQVKGLTGNDSEMEDDSNENSSPLFQPLPQKRPSSTNLHEVTQIYHDTNKRPHRANDNERVISAPPPIKRMHSELAPKPLSPPVKTNDELETFEIRIPKMETVEIDSDPEVSENSMQEDPLSQLLSSESSHQEMKIGANSDLSNVPGVSQDANNQGSQQRQHFITSSKGRVQLAYMGYIYNADRKRDNVVFWRCASYQRGCRARCTTLDNVVRNVKSSHNHVACHDKILRRPTVSGALVDCVVLPGLSFDS